MFRGDWDQVGEGIADDAIVDYPQSGERLIGRRACLTVFATAPAGRPRVIKPDAPFASCPLHQGEYVISGRIRYVLDDGTSVEAGPGDHLLIDPGHQAEVSGEEACVVLDW